MSLLCQLCASIMEILLYTALNSLVLFWKLLVPECSKLSFGALNFQNFLGGTSPKPPYPFRADLIRIDSSHVTPTKIPKSSIKNPFQQP